MTAIDPSAKSVLLKSDDSGHRCLAISPDSRWLVTGGNLRRAVRLWDLNSKDLGSHSTALINEIGNVQALVVSNDQQWIAGGCDDGATRVWKLQEANPASTVMALRAGDSTATKAVTKVVFSGNSHWILTNSEGIKRLWDWRVPSSTLKAFVMGEKDASAMAFSPDSRWLITGNHAGSVALHDLKETKPDTVFTGHRRAIVGIALSTDSRLLFTTSEDQTVRRWDLESSDPVATSKVFRGSDRISPWRAAVVVGNDAEWLCSNDGNNARLWDLRSKKDGAEPITLHGPKGTLTVAISKTGRWIVASGDSILLWDLTQRNPVEYLLPGKWGCFTFTEDEHWLLGGSPNGQVLRWDLTAKELTTVPSILADHGDMVTEIVASQNSRWVASGSQLKGTLLRLSDLAATDANVSRVLPGHSKDVTALAITSDSHWLASSGSDKIVRLWNLLDPDPGSKSIVLPQEDVVDVLLTTADSKWLITANSRNAPARARQWDLRAKDIAASSTEIASKMRSWITIRDHLWNLQHRDGKARPRETRDATISGIANALISSDSRFVIGGESSYIGFPPRKGGTVRVWDVSSDEPIRLRGLVGGVAGLTMSSDSRWVAAASDSTICVWHLQPADLLEIARISVGRNMTNEEWAQYFLDIPYRKTFLELPLPTDWKAPPP